MQPTKVVLCTLVLVFVGCASAQNAAGDYTLTQCTCGAGGECTISCDPLPEDCLSGYQFPSEVQATQSGSSLSFFSEGGQIDNAGNVQMTTSVGRRLGGWSFQCNGRLASAETGNRVMTLQCQVPDRTCNVEYEAGPATSGVPTPSTTPTESATPSPSATPTESATPSPPIGGVVGEVPQETPESTARSIVGTASYGEGITELANDVQVTCYNQIASGGYVLCSAHTNLAGFFNCSFDIAEITVDLIPFCIFRAYDASGKATTNFVSGTLSTTEPNNVLLKTGASVFGLVQYTFHGEVFHPSGVNVVCYDNFLLGDPTTATKICETTTMNTGYFQCFYDASKVTHPRIFCDFSSAEIVSPYRSNYLSEAVDAQNVVIVHRDRTKHCPSSYNGCGPAIAVPGSFASMVPETYLTLACNNHDCCYSDCLENQQICDSEMEDTSRSICRQTAFWSHQTATSLLEVTELAINLTLRRGITDPLAVASLISLFGALTVFCEPLPEIYYLAIHTQGQEAWASAQQNCFT